MRLRILLAVALAWGGSIALLSCGRENASAALSTWNSFYKQQADRIPKELATNPGTPWGDYVGSLACAGCHAEEYGKWRESFHSRTLYDAVPKTLFGDFASSVVYDDPTVRLGKRRNYLRIQAYAKTDPATGRTRFFMSLRLQPGVKRLANWRKLVDAYGAGVPDELEGEFEILYAFGNRRDQPYVARWPDGRHWVLPLFWNDADKAWRFCGFRPYVDSCAQCHTTGIKSADRPYFPQQTYFSPTAPDDPVTGKPGERRFNLPADREGWADGAVGCELCHGPGRKHVETVNAMGVERYRTGIAAKEIEPTIYDAKTDIEYETYQCDQCHDFMTETTLTYVPGPHGYGRPPAKFPIRAEDDPGGRQFYADGSHRSPCSTGTIYRGAKMFHAGVKCTACHDPHGNADWAELRLPIAKNELCLSCHQKDFPTIDDEVKHSRHAAGSPGNRCVECHMPRHGVFTNGIDDMSDRLPKHEFSIPTGVRAPGGPPPSCNVCHQDKTDQWTQDVLRAWKEGKTPPK